MYSVPCSLDYRVCGTAKYTVEECEGADEREIPLPRGGDGEGVTRSIIPCEHVVIPIVIIITAFTMILLLLLLYRQRARMMIS